MKKIIDFGNNQVFDGVNVLTSIIFLSNGNKVEHNQVAIVKPDEGSVLDFLYQSERDYEIKRFQDEMSGDIWIFNSDITNKVISKIEGGAKPLKEFAKSGAGIQSGLNEVYVVDEKTIKQYKIEKEILRNYAKTRDLKPYYVISRGVKVIRITNEQPINKYPNLKKYLQEHKERLLNRYEAKKNICKWYALAVPRNLDIFDSTKEKIISPIYSKGNKFSYDSGSKKENYFTLSDTVAIQVRKKGFSTKYILAILNSKVLNYYYRKTRKLKRDNYFEYLSKSLDNLPIKYSESCAQKIEIYVTKLLTIIEKKSSSQIKELLIKIDSEVYKLYGLTKDEIKIIEESVK